MSEKPYVFRRPPHIVEFLSHAGREARQYWNIPLWIDADMEAAHATKERLHLTYYPLIIRAVSQAVREGMQKHPEFNAMRVGWLWKRLVYFRDIVTAITMASETNGESSFHLCLMQNADRKSLAEISQELNTHRHAGTADPTYKLPRWLMRPLLWLGANVPSLILKYRGTVLITSLGAHGVNFYSMGNRNLAFSYGPVEKRPVVVTNAAGEDSVAIRRQTTVTMAADHRTLEGLATAQLLARVRQLLEQPPAEWG